MCRIIVTVLLGFLNVGRLTSTLVFIYVFCANAFFLVSPSAPHIHDPSPNCDYTMRLRVDLTNSYVPSNTSFSPIHPKLPQSLPLPFLTLSEPDGFISFSSWLVVKSSGWGGYLESRRMHALILNMLVL